MSRIHPFQPGKDINVRIEKPLLSHNLYEHQSDKKHSAVKGKKLMEEYSEGIEKKAEEGDDPQLAMDDESNFGISK
jgi:hypothetical protein